LYDQDVAGRYLKPGFVLSHVMNPLLMRIGLVPTLAVRGRTSGEWRTVPVNVLVRDGKRYLVAPRGDTHWARNLRAAGRGELRTRRGAEPFTVVELPGDEKEPIIAAYLERWGSQVRSQFRELPDPTDHPVFRLEPESG
jgi:deazaflavin-dependent oxidoreductase (nitroreductase family)